jgi:hypothetical protein
MLLRCKFVNDTLTAKILEETLTFLEKTFRNELSTIDFTLAWSIHLVIGLLFVVPAVSVVFQWLRKAFVRSGRQEVLVCGHCREEVHEHFVRCPSCEAVFPSSFLRALLTLGILFLASWTAEQQGHPAIFWSLISLYGVIIIAVGLFVWSAKFREIKAAKAVHSLVGRCVDATIKGRELWARGEALVRILVVLVFYSSLILGLHQYGLPSAQSEGSLAEVLTKLTFVCGLLSFTSLAVLVAQLRRFQGFATLVLAFSALLFFTLGTIVSHGLSGAVRVKQRASPDHWVLSATKLGAGKVEIRFKNASGHKVRSVVKVHDASQLRFTTSLLLVKRFAYRRYFLLAVPCDSVIGVLPPNPRERSTQMSFWQTIWTPSLWIYHLYSTAGNKELPDWVTKIEAKVDPQEPRTWKVPLNQGKELEIFIDGIRIFYREKGVKELTELERA